MGAERQLEVGMFGKNKEKVLLLNGFDGTRVVKKTVHINGRTLVPYAHEYIELYEDGTTSYRGRMKWELIHKE